MNHDRLRTDLADLAEEVTPVDLRDRALRTSRRLGIQRAIATSAAAVVMLGAATGTAFALMPRGESPAPTPAGPAETATWPPVEPSPTPKPSPTSEPTVTRTIGRIFYGPAPDNFTASNARLRSWKPGGALTDLLSIPRVPALTNAAVSPNGQQVAWVDEDGTLWVAMTDGSGRRMLHTGVDGTCWGPAWTADGSLLSAALVDPADPGKIRRGNIDVDRGGFTDMGGKEESCHPIRSGDGEYLAYIDGSDGRVIMTNGSGFVHGAIPGLGGDAAFDSFDVASLSPDGSRIALLRRGPGEESGDVARELTANAVLDTRTGEEIRLPLEGRELHQAYFQADGSLVARVVDGDGFVLLLISSDGRKISETAEPAALKDMQILATTS